MKYRWLPAIVLGVGAALTMGVTKQRALPLQRPLGDVVPREILGYLAQDASVSDAEARVAGFSNYLFRVYERPAPSPETHGEPEPGNPLPWFSLYVGYYESQAQGRTIHSPRNCLPGAGWEALSSELLPLEVDGRVLEVNRYLLQNEGERALVLYWYQGRGRVSGNEYRVKLNLLRDAAVRRRSDEALVRIVVPVVGGDDLTATEFAATMAREVIPDLDLALPR